MCSPPLTDRSHFTVLADVKASRAFPVGSLDRDAIASNQKWGDLAVFRLKGLRVSSSLVDVGDDLRHNFEKLLLDRRATVVTVVLGC